MVLASVRQRGVKLRHSGLIAVLFSFSRLVLPQSIQRALNELFYFCLNLLSEQSEVVQLLLVCPPALQGGSGSGVVFAETTKFRHPTIKPPDGQFVHLKMFDHRG